MRGKRRKGRSRADGDAERMNAWAAWSGARRGDGARSLWGATLREVGAEEPTEVMMNGMTLMAIDEAWRSDRCVARRWMLSRWWRWWRCWLSTMALTGQWVARRWGRIVNDDGRLAAVSRASRRCKNQCSWQWIAEQIELRWNYLCCSVSQGCDVITPESSVRWEEDSGPG